MRINLPILLVEDDLVDIMTTRRALDDLNITNPLIVANDGEEALLLLGKEEANKPGIIILDINMPRMNGIELLKHLKNDEELKRIPVVVLTTSKEEEDKIESFSLGVAGYMIKPVDYLKFVEVIRTIDMYWTLSELPETEWSNG
jgi:CheY-like chemotaxis protein